jgi:hypothetical protein
MARTTIPNVSISNGAAIEPAPVTLDANGGALPCAWQIVRLHNSTGSELDVTVHSGADNAFDINVSVDAGSVVYLKIVDTTFYRQSDGTIYIDGAGIDVVSLTL